MTIPRYYGWIQYGSTGLFTASRAICARKLDAINTKILFIDKHVQQQRASISKRNHEAIQCHLKGKKALEIGRGQGSFLGTLLSTKSDCFGVDLSPEMVAHAGSEMPDRGTPSWIRAALISKIERSIS
jgi:cyclopropane fatty-acyl-phospholipid synthase-like methyltransferase